MRFVPQVFLSLLFFVSWASAQETVRFRLWLAGQEAGGSTIERKILAEGPAVETREWMKIARGAASVEQEARHAVKRGKDGSLAFTWSLRIAQEPLEGKATWSPVRPGIVRLEPKGGPPKELAVPAGAVLWPGDLDQRMKDAARTRSALKATTFNPNSEGWDEMDLAFAGTDPLPGWGDAVRFKGRLQEGPTKMEAEVWISPKDGELKMSRQLMGLTVLVQRAELPAPGESSQAGFFDRSMKRLPPHPFMLWIPELTVRWTGTEKLDLPEDPQQKRIGDHRLSLRQAALPSAEEARDLPVKGKPAAADEPFLVATPLLPYRDPAFDGPLFRLAAPAAATRWELARKVTSFVFEWITEKDYSVGFANAAEVCRTPKGDCTEHGVLAIALLRRLGVPARGVMGWVALGDTLALHFWVEVKLKDRWLPVDPTFDQAPASAFRVKLGTTDLANIASVGWESAAQVFGGGRWVPEKEADLSWGKGLYITGGDDIGGPAVGHLDFPGAGWVLDKGRLSLTGYGLRNPVEAVVRPGPASVQDATRIKATQGGNNGWYLPADRRLWLDLGGRWIMVDRLREAEAVKLVEFMRFTPPPR